MLHDLYCYVNLKYVISCSWYWIFGRFGRLAWGMGHGIYSRVLHTYLNRGETIIIFCVRARHLPLVKLMWLGFDRPVHILIWTAGPNCYGSWKLEESEKCIDAANGVHNAPNILYRMKKEWSKYLSVWSEKCLIWTESDMNGSAFFIIFRVSRGLACNMGKGNITFLTKCRLWNEIKYACSCFGIFI